MAFEHFQETPPESEAGDSKIENHNLPPDNPKEAKKRVQEIKAALQHEGLKMFSHAYQRFEENRKTKKSSRAHDLYVEKISNNSAVKSYLDVKRSIEALDVEKDYGDPKKNEIVPSLKQDLDDLIASALEYVKTSDKEEEYAKRYGSMITEESKAKLEEVGKDRTAAHNILMGNLNIIKFYLDIMGIDNNLMRAIVGEDRKLDLNDNRAPIPQMKDPGGDRRRVEVWARAIADYLATVSETTAN